MDENLAKEKLDILKWIEDLQDENIIEDLLKLKKSSEKNTSVNESKLEYAVTDDFEERWARGLTKEQSIERTKGKIREWWGK